MKLGYSVSIPFGDNDRYDLIVDDGQLHKVQVKTANYQGDKLTFNCYSDVYSEGDRKTKTYTEDEIDAYVVYCHETEEIFWVDVEDAGKSTMSIRLEGGRKNSNMKKDFILGGIV